MPRSVYTSDSFLQAELDQIFSKDWFCAGRASSISRAQSNVCLHRMSTLLDGRGQTNSIVCPYHAWTYELNGTLRGAPAMTENKAFCKKGMQLPSVRCEEWLGWIMVTLNANASPVQEQLAEVESMVADYDMENYQETFFETHVWDTNWKVLAENFMESYHLPVCHRGTIGGLSKLDEMICPPGHDAFNYHTILKDENFKIGVAHPNNTRMEGERRRTTYLLALYPSLLITLTPGYFWYLSLHPVGVGKVRIMFGGGMSKDFMADEDAKEHFSELKTLLDDVNIEDRGCTEKVYKGLCSGYAKPGPLSHLERPNYDFAQYLASRVNTMSSV